MNTNARPSSDTLAGQSLSVWGLTKDYGSNRVLNDVSLSVEAGEFLTLLGPSGSGKTTVLMALAGFVDPTHGKIVIDGKEISSLPAEKRNFGVVFQGYALFPHLTVAGNIAFPLKVRGIDAATRKKRVEEVLRLVRLEAFADRKPRQLSGGQQQRVALARALAFKPSILLLDEPMGALDRKLKEELQAELRELHKTIGTTFINVTHDQEEAMGLSDRIAIMSEGKLVEIGTPQALYSRPKTKFVAGFLGKSNFIEGTVTQIEGYEATVQVGSCLLKHRFSDENPMAQGDAVTLALRPERIRLGSPRPGEETGLGGTIIEVVPCGATAELKIQTNLNQFVTAILPAHNLSEETVYPGAATELSWPTEATVAVQD